MVVPLLENMIQPASTHLHQMPVRLELRPPGPHRPSSPSLPSLSLLPARHLYTCLLAFFWFGDLLPGAVLSRDDAVAAGTVPLGLTCEMLLARDLVPGCLFVERVH